MQLRLHTNYIFLFIAGGEAGTVLCLTISGILASNFGWECTFYVWGTFGCIWFIFWICLIYDCPQDHPRMSENERRYIMNNTHNSYKALSLSEKLPPPPIWRIITSVPVIANIVTALGQNYGFYTILKMTPTYLNNIQHISIQNVGYVYKKCI